jgi:hypothetical protein
MGSGGGRGERPHQVNAVAAGTPHAGATPCHSTLGKKKGTAFSSGLDQTSVPLQRPAADTAVEVLAAGRLTQGFG